MNPRILLPAALFGGALLFGGLAHTNTGNPPNARTSAPGETRNCSDCHGNVVANASRFQITFPNGDTAFEAAQRILLHVEHFNTPTARNGFEITAVNNAGTAYGTLEVTDATNTLVERVGAAGKQYLKHSTTGSLHGGSWDLAWNAPTRTTDTTSVRFFAAGVQANNNGRDDAGDQVFLAHVRLPFRQTITGIQAPVLNTESVRLYPNPCAEAVHIQLQLAQGAPVTARLYSATGIQVASETFLVESGSQTLRWQFGAQAAGTYILRLTAHGFTTAHSLQIR